MLALGQSSQFAILYGGPLPSIEVQHISEVVEQFIQIVQLNFPVSKPWMQTKGTEVKLHKGWTSVLEESELSALPAVFSLGDEPITTFMQEAEWTPMLVYIQYQELNPCCAAFSKSLQCVK